MWAVSRVLFFSDGTALHEFLSLDSQERVFWTGWESELTFFNDYELALKYATALNILYGYEVCTVTTGPDWTPDVGIPHG